MVQLTNFKSLPSLAHFLINIGDKELIEFLQQEHLLKSVSRCPKNQCRSATRLAVRPDYKGGYAAECVKCKKRMNLCKGSFFENTALIFRNIIFLLFVWSRLISAHGANGLVKVSHNSVIQYFAFFRDICSWKIVQRPQDFIFGGPGLVVQVDESLVAKRKYHRGRPVPQQWVLGIYGCDAKRGVILFVKDRKRRTLHRLIRKHVRRGSYVWTDEWKAYRRLSQLGYTHQTVNHKRNFVDPVQRVHTNNVEGYWSTLKTYLRRRSVMHSKLLPEHVDEFMWNNIYGKSHSERFANILRHIKERYPV